MRFWQALTVGFLGVTFSAASAAGVLKSNLPNGPGFEEVLSVAKVTGAVISPDGSSIAYTVRQTDWDNNRWDTEIYISHRGKEPFQLTDTKKGSSTGPTWSPDSQWIAFAADRGKGRQIYLAPASGGEAIQLTSLRGIQGFKWSPDGRSMALLLGEPGAMSMLTRSERFGDFTVEEEDSFWAHLWLLDIAKARAAEGGATRSREKGEGALRQLTKGREFTIGSFRGEAFNFSPDGKQIAFTHTREPSIHETLFSDISTVDVRSGVVKPLVTKPGFDSGPVYSPDGRWILFYSKEKDVAFTANMNIARIPARGGKATILTADFDEHVVKYRWLPQGIQFLANLRTSQQIFQLDPDTRAIRQLTTAPNAITSVSYSADGSELAVIGHSGAKLPEIYRISASDYKPQVLTDMTAAVAHWPQHSYEIIQWTAEDGVEVEGILYKPANFKKGKRYPLLVQIHGGPIYADKPARLFNWEYPVEQWLNKGAVVLLPNYRGSNGYGEKFRSLNVRNGGIGASRDIMAGVDYLIDQGIADPDRMGVMGWSHGGYLSAFLLTQTDRFKAVSVGAGIVDWITNNATTDIYPAMKYGFKAYPWEDPEIYAITSPMHYIANARTPTLIQHGDSDSRVPTPNGYQLFRALKLQGVETRYIVFKDTGHMLNGPKERLAAQWQNWQWFSKYVWGEDLALPYE